VAAGGEVKLVCQGKDERQELVGLCPLLWGRSKNGKIPLLWCSWG